MGHPPEEAEELDPPTAIPGTSWVVTAYDNGSGKLVDVLEDTDLTADFSREAPNKGTLSGSAGCNFYSSEYDVAGEWLGIGGSQYGTVTEDVCTIPDGVMEQEAAYLAAVDKSANGFWMNMSWI